MAAALLGEAERGAKGSESDGVNRVFIGGMTQLSPVKAQDVLRSYWDGRIPVDLFALARALGVNIVGGLEAEEEGAGLCAVVSCDTVSPKVRLSSSALELRRRFALAHAIGHVCLRHQGDFYDRIATYSVTERDSAEAACNRFAMELLMPESAIKNLIVKRNVTDLRRLAQLFAVSEVAMRYRLQRLGWIPR